MHGQQNIKKRRAVVGNYLAHNKLTEGIPNTSLKSR